MGARAGNVQLRGAITQGTTLRLTSASAIVHVGMNGVSASDRVASCVGGAAKRRLGVGWGGCGVGWGVNVKPAKSAGQSAPLKV